MIGELIFFYVMGLFLFLFAHGWDFDSGHKLPLTTWKGRTDEATTMGFIFAFAGWPLVLCYYLGLATWWCLRTLIGVTKVGRYMWKGIRDLLPERRPEPPKAQARYSAQGSWRDSE